MSRKTKKSIKKKDPHQLPILKPNAAGIDVATHEIVVAVPPGRDPEPIRTFQTFTEDLERLADWLVTLGVDSVALESTSTYWVPIVQILEPRGIEVCLVNARHVRNVPGRKTDVQDAEWLRFLHSVGLLRASFRPPDEVCAVRSLLRHRQHLVGQAGMHTQLMHKALTQMNLQLHNVISDVTGVSGLRILRAVLDGERDPVVLAKLCDRRIKADAKTVAKSLKGDWRPEHVFVLRQCVEAWDHIQAQMEVLDLEIQRLLAAMETKAATPELPAGAKPPSARTRNAPAFDLRSEMYRIFGTDLTQVPGVDSNTAWTFLGEVGTDVHRFASPGHFCSWLGLSPGNKTSGGKVLSSRTRKVVNRLSTALRMAAQCLWRAKNPMGQMFRNLLLRFGAPKAITATAHRLARILFVMVRDRVPYDPEHLRKHTEQQEKRRLKRLEKEASRMGFKLVAA